MYAFPPPVCLVLSDSNVRELVSRLAAAALPTAISQLAADDQLWLCHHIFSPLLAPLFPFPFSLLPGKVYKKMAQVVV
jgi:hypothetical protein